MKFFGKTDHKQPIFTEQEAENFKTMIENIKHDLDQTIKDSGPGIEGLEAEEDLARWETIKNLTEAEVLLSNIETDMIGFIEIGKSPTEHAKKLWQRHLKMVQNFINI